MTNLTTSTDLGRAIRDRRLELGYTQQQLAERVGVARQWIVKVENGKARAELDPLLRTLFQLDLELHVSPVERADDLDDYVQSFADELDPPTAAGVDR